VIDSAAFNDHEPIAELLTAAGLPVPDGRDSLVHMLVARDQTGVSGCIGWEGYGAAALLRSLAVRTDARSRGLGSQLVAVLLERLRGAGVRDVYLLTADAAGFFGRHGFKPAERAAVPATVRMSFQFGAGTCSTATCMHSKLA
jgi:amino-acid N-acetyltransferase